MAIFMKEKSKEKEIITLAKGQSLQEIGVKMKKFRAN